jgi:mxaJ protein
MTRLRPRRPLGGALVATFGLLVLAALVWLGRAPSAPSRELRVCADPNNLPFSNEREEGFENRLAALVAREMGATVRYTWWAQRRGFVRHTLGAGECDVIMGVPTTFELVLPTAPYYRSTYVFVYRQDRGLDIRTFDDEPLRTLQIGVHVIGDDYANPPPAHALASRGIIRNVVGYSIYGDYAQPDPPAGLVRAVADGEVDVAIVWGPLAGYFAARERLPLELVPVSPEVDLPFLPFVFDMSMGVRRGDDALKDELDEILRRNAPEIDALLEEFGFPFVRRVRRSASAGLP